MPRMFRNFDAAGDAGAVLAKTKIVMQFNKLPAYTCHYAAGSGTILTMAAHNVQQLPKNKANKTIKIDVSKVILK